ncbi:MFS transporter [bacterium]|nr:MFS transporter [bacterium]
MKQNSFSLKGFVVWFICAIFFMYEFLLRTVVGTFQQQIMHDLQLSNVQFSFISTTIFLLVYGFMQIPAGIIVDNFGLKKAVFTGSIFCAIGAFCFANSHGFYLGLLSRMIMGFGAAFGFICVLMAVKDWMPYKYIAIFIGLSQFIGTIGPMGAAGPLEKIAHHSNIPWQDVFYGLGLTSIAIAILVLLFVENNRHSSGAFILLYKPEKVLLTLKKLFFRLQPWLIAIASTCVYFSIEYLTENEGRYFLTLKGVNALSASNILTLSWVGFALGCPMIGFFSDYFEKRKSYFMLCNYIGLIATCMIVFLQGSLWMHIAFFLLGVGASGINLGFAFIGEQFNAKYLAVGFGLTNAIVMSISAINAPLIGALIEGLSSKISSPLASYSYAFFVLIAISLIGTLISLFFIKETFCKSSVEFTILPAKR